MFYSTGSWCQWGGKFDHESIILPLAKGPQPRDLLYNFISIFCLDGLKKKFFDGVRYDVMATYSSLEHSGLGRYSKTMFLG
jgi:hypothetical protein